MQHSNNKEADLKLKKLTEKQEIYKEKQTKKLNWNFVRKEAYKPNIYRLRKFLKHLF